MYSYPVHLLCHCQVKRTPRVNTPSQNLTLSAKTSAPMTLPLGGFESENVILKAWLDLGAFGNPSNGNDCWGYTSPSGREYALMGLYNKMTVVEITNPANPVIIDSISHSGSSGQTLRYIKTSPMFQMKTVAESM